MEHACVHALIDDRFRDVFWEEKDVKDPLAGVAESIGYMRGVLSGLMKSGRT